MYTVLFIMLCSWFATHPMEHLVEIPLDYEDSQGISALVMSFKDPKLARLVDFIDHKDTYEELDDATKKKLVRKYSKLEAFYRTCAQATAHVEIDNKEAFYSKILYTFKNSYQKNVLLTYFVKIPYVHVTYVPESQIGTVRDQLSKDELEMLTQKKCCHVV